MALNNLTPITRLEKFLHKIAGGSVSISPITRQEYFLDKIAEHIADAGGGLTVFFEPPGEEPGVGDPDLSTSATISSITSELLAYDGKPIMFKLWQESGDYLQTQTARYNPSTLAVEIVFTKYDLTGNTCQNIVVEMSDDYVAYSHVYNVSVSVPT